MSNSNSTKVQAEEHLDVHGVGIEFTSGDRFTSTFGSESNATEFRVKRRGQFSNVSVKVNEWFDPADGDAYVSTSTHWGDGLNGGGKVEVFGPEKTGRAAGRTFVTVESDSTRGDQLFLSIETARRIAEAVAEYDADS